uniref:Uncharacterized protein n=1 Tax=Pyxicephalus adspersus TaxID=30357 RepID=A0AAV3AK24_PYXAD|nr:TPA: hypothetical protein GDO54_008553 [Pyxicephalus adspersus]
MLGVLKKQLSIHSSTVSIFKQIRVLSPEIFIPFWSLQCSDMRFLFPGKSQHFPLLALLQCTFLQHFHLVFGFLHYLFRLQLQS